MIARIFHQPTAAGAHLPHFAKAMWGRPEFSALGSDKGLDVLYSTPAHFVFRASCISGRLRALATRSGEKCGLAGEADSAWDVFRRREYPILSSSVAGQNQP